LDIIYKLARNIVNTQYQDIPREEIEREKLSALDIMGTSIAGATAPGCEALVEYAREMGGREESTIMMYGDKVPAENAALVNATMARALDFEAAGGGPSHCHASILPTAFAMSERLGGVSGKDFLTAMVLAVDLSYRICNSWKVRANGWDTSIAVAIFATTAVASRLLRLDENQMVNAFGIALGQIAGTPQPSCDGALTVRVYSGLAARAGVFSTILAQKGITGSQNVLQGDYGYYNIYARGDYNPETPLVGLGEKFHSVETQFKMYPCCALTHATAEGMIELATKHDIKPDDVEEIIISVVKGKQDFTAVMCHPFEIRDTPQVDAQFSHRYVAASSLLRRSCRLEHFTDEYVRDPQVQELITKVKVERVIEPPPDAYPPVRSEIIKKDGKRYSIQIDYLRGSIERPVSQEEIVEKFRGNVAYSGKTSRVLPVKAGEEIIELIEHMEELDNVNQINKLAVA
jgi:2-methylcitrate dehydratase PrpD